MRERITSFASVEYVIVVKKNAVTTTTKHRCAAESRGAMLGISGSDKDRDNNEELGRKD